MERKIVQIAFRVSGDISTEEGVSNMWTSGDIGSQLFALCNDGTILYENKSDNWEIYNIGPVPQPEEEGKK